MNTDESLAVLLKLVNGNKEQCLQLVEKVRRAYPNQSMQWCIQKAIYDVRYGKKAVQPNAKLSRWGEGGGTFAASPSPVAKTQTPSPVKPSPQLPPPPPPNLALSTPPKPQETIPSVLPDLAALAEAKRKQYVSIPASPIIKNRLDYLTKDRRVSDRLVQRLRVSNPNQSEQWCYEKAIYDLERDRI